jgi:hypothetical protein
MSLHAVVTSALVMSAFAAETPNEAIVSDFRRMDEIFDSAAWSSMTLSLCWSGRNRGECNVQPPT